MVCTHPLQPRSKLQIVAVHGAQVVMDVLRAPRVQVSPRYHLNRSIFATVQLTYESYLGLLDDKDDERVLCKCVLTSDLSAHASLGSIVLATDYDGPKKVTWSTQPSRLKTSQAPAFFNCVYAHLPYLDLICYFVVIVLLPLGCCGMLALVLDVCW